MFFSHMSNVEVASQLWHTLGLYRFETNVVLNGQKTEVCAVMIYHQKYTMYM